MELDEPTTVTLLKPGKREGVAIHATGLRFTPTRPGAVLEEARRRRIAVSRRPPGPRRAPGALLNVTAIGAAQVAMPPPSTSSPR